MIVIIRCRREWQARRFALTKTAIHFAFQGEELEIDKIPLAEITLIEEMKDCNVGGDEGLSSEVVKAIHIATEEDGNNSGRDYYLQTDPKELDQLIISLRAMSREAKKHRDNHNIFQRAQKKVRRLYEAVPTQSLVCLLFAMVGKVARRGTAEMRSGRGIADHFIRRRFPIGFW